MALPNLPMAPDTFDPFDPLPAATINAIIANILALAAGTGLNDGVVTPAKLNGKMWWEELGRTTLAAAGDTISVTGLPARKYLYVIANLINSGSITAIMRCNGDAAANYAYRYSSGGSADATGASQTSMITGVTNASYPNQLFIEMDNVSTQEKQMYIRSLAGNTLGAANVPGRTEIGGKWANAAAAINQIDILNTSTGDFAVGSELIVLGHN